MDFRRRLRDLHEFLIPHEAIWQHEIMTLYPDPFRDYPPDWVDELARIKEKSSVIELEKKNVKGIVQLPSLLRFYQRIEELCQLPQVPTLPPLPENQFTWLFMIPKKQHEIRRLSPLINEIYRTKNVRGIIDIGGGIGLLAQTVNNHYGLSVKTLDLNPELQKTGIDRHKKNARDPSNRVIYELTKVDETTTFPSDHMTLGLHTCGPLANHQLRQSVSAKLPALINLGCCYNRLDEAPGHQNLSEFSNSFARPLVMNQFALTLASRGHRKMDEKDYDLKLKVKLYRYAIHMLLHDHYGLTELTPLGNSHKKLYEESFGVYALDQFPRIGLTPRHSREELDDYFNNPRRNELIWRMLAAGLIRNAFGRALEVYIQLDRAVYLEEQGYEVKVWEFFEETLSPRNIGIVGTRN